MTFRDLEYVLTLSRCQSITEAANQLHISQPALSKFIQRLEKTLGVNLFLRIGYRLVLTETGEKYISYSEKILQLRTELEGALETARNQQSKILRVALQPVMGSYLIPHTLPSFQQLYPDVIVKVVEGPTGSFSDMLKNRIVDLAFCGICEEDPELAYIPICQAEEVILAVSQQHPMAGEGIWKPGFRYPWINLWRLRNEKFILMQPNQWPAMAARILCQEAGFEPVSSIITSNVQTAMELTAANFGITFLNETHIRFLAPSPRLVCFSVGSQRPLQYQNSGVFRREEPLPDYGLAYIRLVSDAYRKIGDKQLSLST
jgi:DNA-binding transcriptional LysR family regulator